MTPPQPTTSPREQDVCCPILLSLSVVLISVSGYALKAFVSHIGSSAQAGHYVCHIRKDDKWVIFNDRKVAESVDPPKDLGYLYIYETVTE